MKGILLLSHGKLAEGMMDTLEFFFSAEMRQIDYLVMEKTDNLESYKEKLQKKIKEVDSGEGVLMFADLFGGTPSNVATTLLLENTESEALTLITGLNLPTLIEAMHMRDPGPIDIQEILQNGKSQIKCVNEIIKKQEQNNIF